MPRMAKPTPPRKKAAPRPAAAKPALAKPRPGRKTATKPKAPKPSNPTETPQPKVAAPTAGWVLTGRSEPQLPALSHYVRQGRCALFVGAGLSAAAGLPTWRGLMNRMIQRVAPFALDAAGLEAMNKQVQALYKREGGVVLNPLPQAKVQPFFAEHLSWARTEALFQAAQGVNPEHGDAFAQALARVERDSASAAELQALLAAGKYAELAGYCRDLLGRQAFHEELRAALKLPGDIPALHRSVVETPYACIVTTNFDSLLEDAHVRWGQRGIPKAPTGAELGSQGTLLFDESFFILKAHGDLDDEHSIVLTTDDYRRVIHSNPAFQATMGGILQRYAVLFVGYSLSDVNFRLLLDSQLTVFNEHVPPRYALMEGVGPAERDILWRTAKLRVISYPRGEHEVVARVLERLAQESAPKPAPGSAKAATAATAATPRMARPPALYRAELGVKANGEGLALQLQVITPDGRVHEQWSGGCHWPHWAMLRSGLNSITHDGGAELIQASAIGSELQRAWPDELLQLLESVPSDVPVLLGLDAATETVPWEWVIVQGSPLCLRNPVVRQPTGVSDRSRGLRLAGTPLRALVIGDAGLGNGDANAQRLHGAQREAERIAELLRAGGQPHQVTLLNREEATYARLVHEVENGEYDLIHFAGYAGHEDGEGLLSLWDGQVTGSELASILNRRPPSLLVLNSHYTAFAPCGIFDHSTASQAGHRAPGTDRPAPAPLGFMGLAARSGVGAFVGTFNGSLADEAAMAFADAFYDALLRGELFAHALHHARKAQTNVKDITGLTYIGSGHAGLNFRHLLPQRSR